MLSNCGICISDNSESADNFIEQIAFCYVPVAFYFGAISQFITSEDKFTKIQSLELKLFQHVRHLKEDHHPAWHLSHEFCTLSSIWKDLVDCFQTHQASSGKWKVRSWEKCNTKKYWNKSVAARSVWLSLLCTQETRNLLGYDFQRQVFASHTNTYVHMPTRSYRAQIIMKYS